MGGSTDVDGLTRHGALPRLRPVDGPVDGPADGPANGPAGATADPATPRPGRLVGLRATELAVRWVGDRRLRIEVSQIGGDAANVLYGFEVFGIDDPAHRRRLANGRAIVTLEAA